jgi:PhoH-like ATPase
MPKPKFSGSRLFVLDTNVLMHDPTSIFRFQEHNIYIPLAVLEELDNHKKGLSEVSRNVRQVSRYFDQLMSSCDENNIHKGIPLGSSPYALPEERIDGLLFFQTSEIKPDDSNIGLIASKVDNTIVNIALALQQENADKQVTLISKDINLRIKAKILGINAEDYFNDHVTYDIEDLFTGTNLLPNDFWDSHNKEMKSWQEEGRTFYQVKGPLIDSWTVNQFVYMDDGSNFSAIVRDKDKESATIELITDHAAPNNDVWGITARNIEQSFALNLLMDPEIDFVSLLGSAGTGKTLLALAAALEQTIEKKIYNEIIVTRVTIPVGEDIGFLPGTEEASYCVSSELACPYCDSTCCRNE